MIHQYKVELQERIKNEERENNYFSRGNVRENNKKFIENKTRIKKSKKKKIVINTKLSKSCNKITYFLVYYIYI